MHYKTIVLEMLQDRPMLYEKLRSTKRLLPSLEAYAADLREDHLAWKASLSRTRPGSDPRHIASEALELAIDAMATRLPCGSSRNEEPPAEDDPATTPASSDTSPE